jgi:hypothetical protein
MTSIAPCLRRAGFFTVLCEIPRMFIPSGTNLEVSLRDPYGAVLALFQQWLAMTRPKVLYWICWLLLGAVLTIVFFTRG